MKKQKVQPDPIQDHRRDRLKNLIKKFGKQADFANKFSLEANYVSQLINRWCSFGEKAARELEKSIGLPEGWFDFKEEQDIKFNLRVDEINPLPYKKTSQLTPREIAILNLFNALPKSEQEAFFENLEKTKCFYEKVFEEMSIKKQVNSKK